MATKRNNAGKRLQYSVPLPLPALQQQQQQQQKQPQQQQQKHVQPQTPSTATNDLSLQRQSVSSSTTCPSSWLLHPLRTILSAALKYLHLQHDNTKGSPTTTQDLIHGEFHFSGASVWIHEGKDMEILFRQGFFGKGTLSRSEATWKERTAGSSQGVSLEEITRQRRVERAQLKMEKLVLAQQGNASALPVSTTPLISSNTSSTNASGFTTPVSTVSSLSQSQDPQLNNTVQQSIMPLTSPIGGDPEGVNQETVSSSSGSGENEEHLQLSLEEAFFLVFAVECIAVSEQKTSSTCDQLLGGDPAGVTPFSIQECWLRFAQASAFAGKPASIPMQMPMPDISPDNPFIVRYAAYHHYRSLGWVVKDGLKYGTDFLLYKKGMIFGHSQFGIRVVACKSAAEVTSNTTHQHRPTGMSPLNLHSSPLSSTPGIFVSHAVHSWQWLLALNRVISQVQKTVILCHVIVPSHVSKQQLSHPLKALPLYTIVEVGIKRFIPEKNRK